MKGNWCKWSQMFAHLAFFVQTFQTWHSGPKPLHFCTIGPCGWIPSKRTISFAPEMHFLLKINCICSLKFSKSNNRNSNYFFSAYFCSQSLRNSKVNPFFVNFPNPTTPSPPSPTTSTYPLQPSIIIKRTQPFPLK